MNKTYLGDSVYVRTDGAGDILLTTENGGDPSNRIVLEAEVIENLLAYLEAMHLQLLESSQE